MKAVKGIFITLGVVLTLTLVVVGIYLLGWWVTKDTVNRTAKINNDSYNRQNALVEEILADIPEALNPNLPAGQRIAITSQICDSAGKLTGSISIPFSAKTFIQEECK